MDGRTTDKVIPMCRYASQVTQKPNKLCFYFHFKKSYIFTSADFTKDVYFLLIQVNYLISVKMLCF